jgi:hypothetical protein
MVKIRRKKRKNKSIVVVVATRHPGALAALGQYSALPIEQREALTSEGLYRALPDAHLVLADLPDLVECGDVGCDRLAQVLETADVVAVSGAEFAAGPSTYLDRARAASGLAEALPSRSVALTGLSGGVGKTTCAISLARHFRQRTSLPVAVVEMTLGPSALEALLGGTQDLPHLYEVATQDAKWPVWEGITLAPMDWPTAQLLEHQIVARVWERLRESHVLTIFDGPAFHPLWLDAAVPLLDTAYAVSDARPDALVSALHFAAQDDGVPAHVLLNRGDITARIAMPQAPVANLPNVGGKANQYPPRLGRELMKLVYPGWRD